MSAVIDALSDRACTIVTVHGSTDLSAMRTDMEQGPASAGQPKRIRVFLGLKSEGAGVRWLTWEEISGGVIAAIEQGADTVVGDLPG